MNAARKEPKAEHFRCVSIGATISRALCVATWRQRNAETGCAACRVCPDTARKAVHSGKVKFISMRELYDGVLPQEIGTAMDTVPGETREDRGEQAGRRTTMGVKAVWRDKRRSAIVKELTGRPWQSAQEVGNALQEPTNTVRADLLVMVEAGTVLRRRPMVNGRFQRGSLIFFALAADADAPLFAAGIAPTGLKARVMDYLQAHPRAPAPQVAFGIGCTLTRVQTALAQCLSLGWLRREGTRYEGFRWTVTGEAKPNQEGEGDG